MGSWEIIRPLGEGGMGAVDLCRSPEGQVVAVKTLAQSQADQLAAFEMEAKLLIKLRHPAITSILGYLVKSQEIFGQERGPCFWMEYVEGEDILSAAQRVREQEGDLRKIFEWFRQAMEALQFLHGQAVLHSDLSPRNVLIDRSGKLKLLDFGLASSALGSAQFNAGTLPYLAPERVYGQNFPASDLFSMGTLFYEAVSGIHPRAHCRSLQELICTEASPLAGIVPKLNKDFAIAGRIIDRMIQIKLEERFSTAKDVMEALAGGKTTESSPVAEFQSFPMYGADSYLQKVGEALKVLPHQSAILGLHGPTGVGKKRFLKEMAFQCALGGVEVQRVSPPSLKEGLTSLAASTSMGPRAYFFQTLETLSPEDRLRLLHFLRSGPAEQGLLIVLEWNQDGLNEEGRRFFESLRATPRWVDIPLKNLSEEDTRDLLEKSLGKEVAEEIGSVLFQQTGGNPGMLLELVRILRELRLTQKKHFSKEWIQKVQALHNFEDILLQKLGVLPSYERDLLLALATAYAPVPFDVLEGFWENREPKNSELTPLLDLLKQRGLITQDEVTRLYRVSLPGIATFLTQSSSPERLREFHRTWSQIFSGRENFQAEKLHHALALGEAEVVEALASSVAEGLRGQGKEWEALELVQKSLPLLSDPIAISQLLRMKINLLSELGRFDDALKACEENIRLAAQDEPIELKKVKYWIVTGRLHQNLGHGEEAATRFSQGIQEAELHREKEYLPYLIHAHSLLGAHELNLGEIKKAKEHFKKGLEASEARDSRRAEILRYLAAALAQEKNWPEAERSLQEAKSIYREENFFRGEFWTLLQEGNLLAMKGDPDAAKAAYLQAETLAESKGDEINLATVWNNLGVLARKRGDLKKSLDYLSRAQEIFQALGNRLDLAENLTQLAMAETAVGHFKKAYEEIARLKVIAENLPQVEGFYRKAEKYLKVLQDGEFELLNAEIIPTDTLRSHWNKEMAVQTLSGEAKDPQAIQAVLKELYEKLPLSLKVSFEERADYRKWVLPLGK